MLGLGARGRKSVGSESIFIPSQAPWCGSGTDPLPGAGQTHCRECPTEPGDPCGSLEQGRGRSSAGCPRGRGKLQVDMRGLDLVQKLGDKSNF